MIPTILNARPLWCEQKGLRRQFLETLCQIHRNENLQRPRGWWPKKGNQLPMTLASTAVGSACRTGISSAFHPGMHSKACLFSSQLYKRTHQFAFGGDISSIASGAN